MLEMSSGNQFWKDEFLEEELQSSITRSVELVVDAKSEAPTNESSIPFIDVWLCICVTPRARTWLVEKVLLPHRPIERPGEEKATAPPPSHVYVSPTR